MHKMARSEKGLRLLELYGLLKSRFGFQNWWPGETPFEIMVGAILTQNTSWQNVEKAIGNLKSENLLSPERIYNVSSERLAELIKSSGYYNQKAKKLKNFVEFLKENFSFKIENMKKLNLYKLREMLLNVNGIGKETADSILLYALSKKIFVVDAYTKRILKRLLFLNDENCEYDDVRFLIEKEIPKKLSLYKDFHAQFVMLGKNHCKKTKPLCDVCPVAKYCQYG